MWIVDTHAHAVPTALPPKMNYTINTSKTNLSLSLCGVNWRPTNCTNSTKRVFAERVKDKTKMNKEDIRLSLKWHTNLC